VPISLTCHARSSVPTRVSNTTLLHHLEKQLWGNSSLVGENRMFDGITAGLVNLRMAESSTCSNNCGQFYIRWQKGS
jgi:hypothetical protein